MTPERIAELERLEAVLMPILEKGVQGGYEKGLNAGQEAVWYRYLHWFMEGSRTGLSKEEQDARFAFGETLRQLIPEVVARVDAKHLKDSK